MEKDYWAGSRGIKSITNDFVKPYPCGIKVLRNNYRLFVTYLFIYDI